MLRHLLASSPLRRPPPDVVLLALRLVVAASLFFGHGLGKWALVTGDASGFPDPLGLGSRPSVILSMATECGGALCAALGLLTRAASAAVVLTMAVIAVVVHRHDTWGQTEPSVLFAVLFLALGYLGPGRYAVDRLLASRASGRAA